MKEAIFKLEFDCGRAGELTGVFVSTREKVSKLIESGIEVYFGDVLGKHSDVCGAVEEGEITFATDSAEVVQLFKELNLSSGINPFEYRSIGNWEDLGVEEDSDVDDIITAMIELDNGFPNVK